MNTLRYIAVLPAGVKQQHDGKWVSTDLTKADNVIAPGGVLRLHAAALLANESQDVRIITGGGTGYDVLPKATTLQPMLAEILKSELLALGVNESQLIIEHESQTTFQELNTLERLARELSIVHLEIITSRFHEERVEAMLGAKYAEFIAHCEIKVLSAEDILLEREGAKWQGLIEEAYQSEWMKERMKKEQDGILQIKAGTYIFR